MQENVKQLIKDSHTSLKSCATSLIECLNVMDGDNKKFMEQAINSLNTACERLSERIVN